MAGNYEIITVRDSLYLNWRYIECPLTEYKIFAVVDGGLVKGYMVLSCEEGDFLRGNIVDILVSPSEHQIAELLVQKAISYFSDLGAAVIGCWQLEHHSMFSILNKNGFIKRKKQNNFVVRSYVPDMPTEYFLDKKKWFFNMGDTDYY